jgi:hypothetical protein
MRCLAILFLFLQSGLGQVFRMDVPVLIGNDTLANAWCGGLNSPQFSATDLNGDGLKDLVLFDRSDGQLLCFLRVGNQTPASFHFAPQYLSYFPLENLSYWVRLVDYNCDGWEDLFTSVNSYVRVYQRIPGNPPQFFLAYDTLNVEYASGFTGYLYSASVDMPGIADVDFDGDIDFLTWDIMGGTRVEFYRNQAMELLGRCDTLVLKIASTCFGHFYETYDATKNSYDAILNYYCGPGQRNAAGIKHIGGAIEPLNLNGDTLMDIIISDNGPWDMIALTNGGTRQIAHFIDKDTLFPRNTTEARLFLFPAAYYVDVSGDSVRDLLVAPNSEYDYTTEGPANQNQVLYYQNVGKDDSVHLIYQGVFPLINEIMDFGRLAAPAIFDYDQDGDLDLIIGMDTRALPDGTVLPGLALLRNVGTNSQPVFEVVSQDLLQFASNGHTQGIRRVVPAFGDLDGDGDMDLLLGEKNGNLWFFRNVSSGSLTLFQYVTNFFGAIDVGSHAAPTLYDLDGDGDLDLFIGNRQGYIQAYENVGSSTNPSLQLISPEWGNVHITHPYLTNLGNTQPFFYDYDQDGNVELLVASVNPYLVVYKNPVLYPASSFIPVDTISIPYHQGEFKFTIYPYGNTSPYSFILGTVRGGLLWYEPPSSISMISNPSLPIPSFHIYPNPAADRIHVVLSHPHDRIQRCELYNIQGQKVASVSSPSPSMTMDVSHLPPGLYLLKVYTAEALLVKTVVKVNSR